MMAIICLPRQFHVAVNERTHPGDVSKARWLFPAYLIITSLVVIPITVAGLKVLPDTTPPDLFVLALPLAQGDGLLALLVFIGGLSAATGMIIVAAIALSGMVTNHVILPVSIRLGYFDPDRLDVARHLLQVRRGVVLVLMMLAYGYYAVAGQSDALANIGLLSFAAAAQFAPALLGGVYWRDGHRNGALAGLAVGMAIWGLTLFLPALIGHDRMASVLPVWLDPHAIFGLSMGDSLTHGTVWSLLGNTLTYVFASLLASERLRDRVQAAAFVGRDDGQLTSDRRHSGLVADTSPNGLRALVGRFLDPKAVAHHFDDFARETGLEVWGDDPADWRLVQLTERLLSRALGASSARVVMSSAVGGMDVALGDVLTILDEGSRAERFDRHMLQSTLESITHGISVADHEQRLVAWNSAYVNLFAYPPKLVRIGQPVARLIEHNIHTGWIRGDDPKSEAERRIRFMREGRPHVYERRNPDGRYLRIIGSPMPGGGYVSSFADITDDKLREAELIAANEQLEDRVEERTRDLAAMAEDLDLARQDAEGANASKTRFLAAASHDLLQPLNAARLFLGALKSGDMAANPDKLAETVDKADRAIRSADELLKGLLDISRLDHGKITAQPEDLPLGPLLEDLVDEATPMAEKAGLTIRLVPTRLSVHADPNFLQSILRNFLSNARRYTKSGTILVGVRRRGDQLAIQVLDTGPGIPEDRLGDIFEEFRRFEEADNQGLRGAGLGLSVVQRLAGLMGAEINAVSEVGRGSCFEVIVPRGGAVPAPMRLHAARASISGDLRLDGRRVLCVDDEDIIRDGMRTLLTGWGCEVVTARSPAEARTILEHQTFDAVIADYAYLEAETGLAFFASIAQTVPPQCLRALLTAEADALIQAQTVAMGAVLLRKPVDPLDLRAFLGRLKRPSSQAAE